MEGRGLILEFGGFRYRQAAQLASIQTLNRSSKEARNRHGASDTSTLDVWTRVYITVILI